MKVKVGDRIVMRHTYPNCPVLPEYFRTFDNGSYPQGCVRGLQGVYVTVRVTTLPVHTAGAQLVAAARHPRHLNQGD